MKLVELLAIPVGFAIVRSLTKSVEAKPVVTPEPLIPEGFTLGPKGGSMDIAPLFPTGKLELTTRLSTGVKHTGPTTKFGVGTDVVPFFPKGAGDPSLLKPVAGLAGLKPIIPEGAFKITQEQLAAFDPLKPVTRPAFDPTALVAQPIAQGKIKKFGTGVSLADLLARAR